MCFGGGADGQRGAWANKHSNVVGVSCVDGVVARTTGGNIIKRKHKNTDRSTRTKQSRIEQSQKHL